MALNSSRGVERGSGELFEVVVEAMDEWTRKGAGSPGPVKHDLRRFLRRYVSETRCRSAARTITAPRSVGACDLVINDRIGIRIIHHLQTGSKEWIHKELRSLSQQYERLIVYGHHIQAKQRDLWRQIKRSLRRYSTDRNRLAVVGTITDDHRAAPPTDADVAKGLFRRWATYAALLAFLVVGGYALQSLEGGDVMGRAYVGMVIVVNLVAAIFGYFVLRYG